MDIEKLRDMRVEELIQQALDYRRKGDLSCFWFVAGFIGHHAHAEHPQFTIELHEASMARNDSLAETIMVQLQKLREIQS